MKGLPLSEIAYEHILSRIVSFEFAPNIPIIEDDLCSELNISRTPLREALRRLEAEKLVHKVRNRGTFVRNFTYEDIVEISEIRKVFELYSLKRCFEDVVPHKELKSLKVQFENLSETSPNDEYYEADKALHSLIMRYCVNSRMLDYSSSINTQLEMIRRISAQTPNRLTASRREHLEIAMAMLEGDRPLALELLERHLDNVKNSTLHVFQTLKIAF
jgi:DNA-binding GntR family transcriptional regulator